MLSNCSYTHVSQQKHIWSTTGSLSFSQLSPPCFDPQNQSENWILLSPPAQLAGLRSSGCSSSLEIVQSNRMNSPNHCTRMIQETHMSGKTRVPSQTHKIKVKNEFLKGGSSSSPAASRLPGNIERFRLPTETRTGLNCTIHHGEATWKSSTLALKELLRLDPSSPWKQCSDSCGPPCCISRWWF